VSREFIHVGSCECFDPTKLKEQPRSQIDRCLPATSRPQMYGNQLNV
jgi:hypothetical protein